ncbi:vWA domain-containing protein [Brachybacterium subflavum]|uniref:vWA domain-containing protein n=1 Tax=Brachybacterium subflavum TaxID=2585206 RepID=UPI0012665F80|nr:VWA domain-containing protein [Brachybacterium subflavum]
MSTRTWSMARRAVRLLVALLLVQALWTLGAGSARAEGDGGSGGQGEGTDATVPTMLILDASGSMAAKDGDSSGATRMSVAKSAADSLVDELPDGAELGLEVYGAHTGNTAADKAKGCKDVDVIAGVGTDNQKDLHAGIDGVDASGYTPIGKALRTAAKKLPSKGERSIVLVSDGIDSCAPPDPCAVAKDLKKQGVDLAVHAIGFKVDADARKSLQCVADATGGTYTDVSDGDQLSTQLTARTTRALQGYQVEGDAVSGGKSTDEAPGIDAGAYLDTFAHGSTEDLGDDGLTKYYKIPVSPGERVHASAAIVPPPGDRGWATDDDDSHVMFLDAHLVTADGEECDDATTDNIGNITDSETPVRASADSQPAGGSGCEGADGALYLAVERSGAKLADQPLPVEIRVGVQGKSSDSLPKAEEASDAPSVKEQSRVKGTVELGRSAAQAPDLTPGTYRVKMVPGDVGLVKVHAEEGQRLSWHLSTEHAVDKVDDDSSTPDVETASMVMLNPLLQPVPAAGSGDVTEMVVSEDDQYAKSDSMSAPVHLSVLDDDYFTGSEPWLGGDQYLQLGLGSGGGSADDQKSSEPSTFLLTVQVDGTAQTTPDLVRTEAEHEDGAAVTDQDVSAAGSTGDDSTSGTGSASDDGSADGSGGSPSDGGGASDAEDSPRASAEHSSPARTALVVGAVGAGVVALAAIAVGVVLLRRRRG